MAARKIENACAIIAPLQSRNRRNMLNELCVKVWVKACIDWMDVVICTSRQTQFRHLQATLKEITGKKLWVESLGHREGENEIATTFKIRFYDDLANNLSALQSALDKLAESYPPIAEPTIHGIEVACDFWHKGNEAQRTHDLLAMTYRLQSSLFAPGIKPRQFDPNIGTNGGNRFMDEGTRLDPQLNFRIGIPMKQPDTVAIHLKVIA
jgi:hypothetical protein